MPYKRTLNKVVRANPTDDPCPFPSHREESLDWGLLAARRVRCGVCHPDPARWWADHADAPSARAS